jgi:ABC-2 type transport system permease protein
MKAALAIAAREIKSNFVTPTAYVIIAGFMLIAGFFFFTLVQQFNNILAQAAMMPDVSPSLNEWVITPYYQTLEVVMLFLVPILTMRALAEEKRSGTFELLITSPLSTTEIVLGKFLGVAFIVLVICVAAFGFPLVLIAFADPEVAPAVVGFIGIFLFSLSFTAIGLAISAFTKSQTVAGVVSLVVLLLFYVIDAPAAHLGEFGASLLHAIAPGDKTKMLLQGVITGSDVTYFFSIIAVGLFFANRALDAHRWR